MEGSSLYIISSLCVFFSLLSVVYSIYLSAKTKRKTFYFAVFTSFLFLLFVAFLFISAEESGVSVVSFKFLPLLLFLILTWLLTLLTFYKDISKKVDSRAIKDIQKIDKNEKEYLSKVLKKHYSKGKSVKNVLGKNENSITDPVFLELKAPLFIVGMKDTGKTTIGRILAVKLNVDFVDSDDLLLKSIRPRFYSLRHFYRAKGSEAYRDAEALAVYNYIKNLQTPVVIALGGGTAENETLLNSIRSFGYVCYFDMDEDALFKRIVDSGPLPAFVDKKNPESSFKQTFEKRKEVYEGIKDFSVLLDAVLSPYDNAYKAITATEEYFRDPSKVRNIEDSSIDNNLIKLSLKGGK